MSKTFLEKHAAAMVCHRQEYEKGSANGIAGEAFDALADYADELAEQAEGLQDALHDRRDA